MNDNQERITPVDAPEAPAEDQVKVERGGHQSLDDDLPELPAVLPVLPLRGVVVYPQTILPLTVGQPRSVKLVDDVVGGDRLVALVTSKDPSWKHPARTMSIASAQWLPFTACSARPTARFGWWCRASPACASRRSPTPSRISRPA